ncbi:hypothetical protein [Nocardioides sp. T2.26MG-1]|uniref:hypothetical protein n=1 Tax=Nocardioides sp. T2.26MG-1 TaxID=3041166 RepID=UPI002477CA63|nr:hypothetical protein [Nocardioides sp. T2.26MG-1]CAI9419281.1 hypothetical protein HIDPHFAB_03614 [Nocardioides sp. T2.26MG-1]
MSAVGQAAVLVSFPVVAAITGSVASVFTSFSAKATSGVQHFAAGVVFAALASEILPDLRDEGHVVVVVIAFLGGVMLLLFLREISARLESRARVAAVVPLSLTATVGVDLLVDGLLVGVGATLGRTEGIILSIALTLEILFLGLAVSSELLDRGASKRVSALVPSLLGLLTAVGAIGGALLLAGASAAILAAVLAFGAAALLYLVTEELLVEAHESEETPVLAGMFFLGFIIIYAMAA